MKQNVIGVNAAKLAGLQIDLLQKIKSDSEQINLAHLEWFLGLTKEQRDKLTGNTTDDDRFKLLDTFELTVPEDYIYDRQLALFSKNHKKGFYYYNDNITDQNYARVSHKLIPGKTYIGKIYQILKTVSSEGILAFLNEQEGNRFAVAQGLSALWEYSKEKFPVGKWTIAIDKPDNLWKDADGNRRVPLMHRYSDGVWFFDLDHFEGDWNDVHCLVCFCDLE